MYSIRLFISACFFVHILHIQAKYIHENHALTSKRLRLLIRFILFKVSFEPKTNQVAIDSINSEIMSEEVKIMFYSVNKVKSIASNKMNNNTK